MPPLDSNAELPAFGPPDRTYQLVLNLGSVRADTLLMGPIVEDDLVGIGTGRPTARARHRSGASTELRELREKVALLSMQRDYFQQRYLETVEERRAAEAEVLELKVTLSRAGTLATGSDDGRPGSAYVDRRLLS